MKVKDVLDLDILEKLSKDGRLSFRKLSEELNKSPVTIKKHVEELENRGIIENYGININFEKLGYDIIALIELTISKGKMLEVEKDIAKHPNIFAVYDVTGTYDALLIARFKNRKKLSEIIKILNSYESIVRSNTHLILNVIKERSSFVDLLKQEKNEL